MNNQQQKKQSRKSVEHLPHLDLHYQSDVSKVLSQSSTKKQNNMSSSNTFLSNNNLSMRLFKYDFQAKQRCKFQVRNQFSPSKWKVSTNCNSQFNKEKHTKQKLLSGWQMQKVHLSKRSYDQPKQFHGIKSDFFSRQFPQDLSKTYSKGFNKKLKQIQLQYENKVFHGNLKSIEQKGNKSIDAIKSHGTRFQLSKDKLFGFVNPVKKSPTKHTRFHSTISNFYQKIEPKQKYLRKKKTITYSINFQD